MTEMELEELSKFSEEMRRCGTNGNFKQFTTAVQGKLERGIILETNYNEQRKSGEPDLLDAANSQISEIQRKGVGKASEIWRLYWTIRHIGTMDNCHFLRDSLFSAELLSKLRDTSKNAILTNCHVSLRSCLDTYKVFAKEMDNALLARTLEGSSLYRSQELLGTHMYFLAAFLNRQYAPGEWKGQKKTQIMEQRFSLDGSPVWDTTEQNYPREAVVVDIATLIVLHDGRIKRHAEKGIAISMQEMENVARGLIKLEKTSDVTLVDLDMFLAFLGEVEGHLRQKLDNLGLVTEF